MHIVFHREDANTLARSFELDHSFSQELIVIPDDYSLGPINEIDSNEGYRHRQEWWGKVRGEVSADQENSGTETGAILIKSIKERLDSDDEEVVWIWVAANKKDVCGYYWLISQMNIYESRIFVLHLNNLPFINEKGGIFYPEYLYQIPPKEFLKAKKLARPVTPSEFEIDGDEWLKLGNENKTVRILDGAKKLSQHNADFFDASLMSFIPSDYQKVGKIIYQYLSKSKIIVDEDFVFWRIRSLVEDQSIEAQGDMKNKKDLEVKKVIFA